MDFLVPLIRALHVIAAGVWFGGGLYAWMLTHADAAGDQVVVARYSAQLRRVSKVALLMPVSAMGTALFGLLSYGMMRYWERGVFSGFGSIIFHLGVVLGLAATVHGAMAFGKSNREIAELTDAAINADGTTNADKIQGMTAANEKMLQTLNIHSALVIGAFICMTLGAHVA